ncbi:unnamed protein product [Cuscuta campestris]|uniref:TITAN-like protein n=1 Tax=Cuscuta campestris TaxID=132261 RepID=A0A484NPJ4_9ASTE|nr:unnamed protein product [Cuscuta campestris]
MKKKKSNNGFEFCEVCKLNHNQGKKHKYIPNHKKSLEAVLTRFRSKLVDLRFFLKNPTPLRPDQASPNRLWCIFCQLDILELHSFLTGENAIAHLASEDHLKKLKGFLWKYGGGMDKLDFFRITEVDFAKWRKECMTSKNVVASEESYGLLLGPSNDIHNELNSGYVNCVAIDNMHADNINFSNCVVPLQNHTYERSQIYDSELPITCGGNMGSEGKANSSCVINSSKYEVTKRSTPLFPTANLSSHPPFNGSVPLYEKTAKRETTLEISTSVQEDIIGNVHSGAPPPWLNVIQQNQPDFVSKSGENFLHSVYQKRKSSKLNPNRVGAAWAERRKLEMELEKKGEVVMNNADAKWLPNFGRVWQSGSRKESRKEFQMENKPSGILESQSQSVIQLQPYISKRMRKDLGDFTLEQPCSSE